ncbi:MAG: hypothetical protein MZV70_18795 [Desulfobacterales bacterium]|nr:hypothetical protein [Desulfobacterales bacterium]
MTDADLASETEIIATIRSAFPAARASWPRKAGHRRRRRRERWLVDPLDGTVNYAHQVPFFAVSIAFASRRRGAGRRGAQPARAGSCSRPEPASGARLNGAADRVSARKPELSESLLATGFPYDARARASSPWRTGSCAACRAARGVRRFGSAALDLCFVACGRFAGYWEDGLQPWDYGRRDPRSSGRRAGR